MMTIHDQLMPPQIVIIKQIQQAHVLRSSDALEKFLDLLELEFCSFVLQRTIYMILLCFFGFNIVYMQNNVLSASIRRQEQNQGIHEHDQRRQ